MAVAAACGNADIARAPDAAAATVPTIRRWPSGMVRYRLPDALPASERAAIEARLAAIEAITPLHFIDTHGSTAGAPIELRDSVLVDRVIVHETLATASATTPAADVIAGRPTLSPEEVNGLWRAYGQALGSSQRGDKFGAAIAAGDFNGDGYGDVAVGVPGDDIGAPDAGRVHVFRGTAAGLVPWQSIEQSDFGGKDERGDGFGTALAAGDVDGDGDADLLVGVPREDVTVAGRTYIDAGAAVLLAGGADGFTHLRTFTQGTSGTSDEHADAHFGAAVAIGHVAGLATPEIIIGAPGARHPNAFGGIGAGGAVFVFPMSETGASRLFHASNSGGARFGAAIAVGRIDDDGRDDLAIGAPGAGAGARGAVFVFSGDAFAQRLAPPADNDDDFGAAVAIGDVRDGVASEIVVGAPASAGSGRVHIFAATAGPLGASTMHAVQTVQQHGGAVRGGRFGAAVAVGGLAGTAGGPHALVVGAPGHRDGAGSVSVFVAGRGSAELRDLARLQQSQLPWGRDEASDRFGAAVAIDPLDGSIIAGAWGEAPELDRAGAQGPDNAGGIAVFRGVGSGKPGGAQYSQGSATAGDGDVAVR